MTAAPLRIVRNRSIDVGSEQAPDIKGYLDRLLKLIPSEVVAVYIAGVRIIPSHHVPVLGAFLLACVALLIVIRWHATADVTNGLRPQRGAIAISIGAFLIWSFSIGGFFQAFSWYDSYSYVGGLLILLYTTLLPYLYKGD